MVKALAMEGAKVLVTDLADARLMLAAMMVLASTVVSKGMNKEPHIIIATNLHIAI